MAGTLHCPENIQGRVLRSPSRWWGQLLSWVLMLLVRGWVLADTVDLAGCSGRQGCVCVCVTLAGPWAWTGN